MREETQRDMEDLRTVSNITVGLVTRLYNWPDSNKSLLKQLTIKENRKFVTI